MQIASDCTAGRATMHTFTAGRTGASGIGLGSTSPARDSLEVRP